MPERKDAILDKPLPPLNDREGARVPEGLPPVIDTHVHVFPEGIFSALWKWFDTHAWPVRYRMDARDLIGFLFERGISHVIALQYAHKPGIADGLNRFMTDLCAKYPGRLTGLAAVFPGEPDAAGTLGRAFENGLAGVKLHAHVQCFDLNSECMDEIYRTCSKARKPLVIHAGREPKSSAYACDPYDICGVDKIVRVLDSYPELRLCVPHLGADEFKEYARLIESAENLWLDTAMAVTDYLPLKNSVALSNMRADRIMYGSDFPNIPYAWDRELKEIAASGLSYNRLEKILWKNACEFFGIQINGEKKQ